MKWLYLGIAVIVLIEVWCLRKIAKPTKRPAQPFVPNPEHLRRIREEYLSRLPRSFTADPRD